MGRLDRQGGKDRGVNGGSNEGEGEEKVEEKKRKGNTHIQTNRQK